MAANVIPMPTPDIKLSKRDDDLADLLMLATGTYPPLPQRARYDHSKKNWHLWNGFRWKLDDRNEIFEEVRRRALSHIGSGDSSRAKIVAYLLDSSKKESVLKALASRPAIAMVGDEWDTHANLLGCRNGLIDLHNGEFFPEPDPDLLITRSVRAKWVDGATCPRFMKFVSEIMGGDEELALYLVRLLGYALYGNQREQKFWLWVGGGSNGKGTLAKVMSFVLDDYADTPSDLLYMKTKFGASKSGDARADLVKLQGKRWTWMSEPQGGNFNDELIKAHTGDDPIQARSLYSNNYITFRPSHTIIFLTNLAPKVEDVGDSMRRRVRIIRFDEKFSDPGVVDRDLEDKLRGERDGILQLLVRAAVAYHTEGMPEPARVLEWAGEYIDDNDPLGRFLYERCEVGAGKSSSAKLLFDTYQDWAASVDAETLTMTAFGLLMARQFKKERGKSGTTYYGVRARSIVEIAGDGGEDE